MSNRKNYDHLDIEGQRFGKLLALHRKENTQSQWVFRCDCGNVVKLPASRVFWGQQSCGCFRKQTATNWVNNHTIHGQSRTKLYRKYRSMLNRCYRPTDRRYNRYGGRGIEVCEEWRNSFEAFASWAYETGYDPNIGPNEQSIDRIDNDGDYSPTNCRWSNAYEQQQNRECSKLYPYNGKMYSPFEFSKTFGVDKDYTYRHVRKGEALEDVLSEWVRTQNLPDYLTELSEYANKHNITIASVRRKINNGELQGERIGRKLYIYKSEV